MLWATFILFIISGYVALKLFGLSQNGGRLKYLGLTVAAVLFFIMQLGVFINSLIDNNAFSQIVSYSVEGGHILCLAFVLSSLAVFIRESKPAFAQFPLFYTAFPLLIIISYLLVYNTFALKTWLLFIYQGGAILVALLIYSIYTYRRIEYAIILAGVVGFLLCYLLFWFMPDVQGENSWIWKFLLGIGMLFTIWGYETVESENVNIPTLTKSEV